MRSTCSRPERTMATVSSRYLRSGAGHPGSLIGGQYYWRLTSTPARSTTTAALSMTGSIRSMAGPTFAAAAMESRAGPILSMTGPTLSSMGSSFGQYGFGIFHEPGGLVLQLPGEAI